VAVSAIDAVVTNVVPVIELNRLIDGFSYASVERATNPCHEQARCADDEQE
jgi:hypothetical protein